MNLTPRARTLLTLLLGAGLHGASLAADAAESPEQAQAQALAPLAAFDGTWRGPARTLARNGKFLDLLQTERVGPMLGGAIRLVEGRGHAEDGSVQFNALGIFSYDPREKRYGFHSYAQGHEGDFPLTVQPGGFTWEVAAGPARIRYTAKVQGDTWTEIGERLVEGQPPMVIFEMRLRRVGPTGWPAEGALGPK